MSAPLPEYVPSGRVSWKFPAYALFFGLPGLAVLGWLYGMALQLGLYSIIEVAVFVCFAIVCVISISLVCDRGRSRNVSLNTALAILLSVVAFWGRWVVTLYAVSPAEAHGFILSNPVGWCRILWHYASTKALHNPHAFLPLTHCLLWLAEFASVVLLAVALSRNSGRAPFSEPVQAWADNETGGELLVENMSKEEALAMLASKGCAALLALPPAGTVSVTFANSVWHTLEVDGRRVLSDPLARWLTVWLVQQRRSDNGIRTTRTRLVDAWQVSSSEYDNVIDLVRTLAEGSQERTLLATSPEPVAYPEPDAPESPPTPPELLPALDALEAGNCSEAISLATPHTLSADVSLQSDAYRLRALAYSRCRQWAFAHADYRSLFEREETAFNALQLATTAVMADSLAEGNKWFEKATTLNRETRSMPQPRLHTNYLSVLEQHGDLPECLPHLEWLASAYRELKVTDATFLWVRGLPIFSEFLRKSVPVLRICMKGQALQDWYLDMRPFLDDAGKQVLDVHLAQMAAE